MSLPYVSRHVNVSSIRPAGRMGTSPEYIGNRPYQPGDPPRRIDVRAWARLSVPATKEYDDDLDNYAAIVLDTRVPGLSRRPRSGQAWSRSFLAGLLGRLIGGGNAHKDGTGSPQPVKELEAAVSLCASMAYTIHKDCLIDLLLVGTDLHAFTSLPRATRLDRVRGAGGVGPRPTTPPGRSARYGRPAVPKSSSSSCVRTARTSSWPRCRANDCHCTAAVVGGRTPQMAFAAPVVPG
jgi:hypothetical protein